MINSKSADGSIFFIKVIGIGGGGGAGSLLQNECPQQNFFKKWQNPNCWQRVSYGECLLSESFEEILCKGSMQQLFQSARGQFDFK